MSTSSLCERCGEEEESAIHAIWDCKMAKEIWDRLIPPELLMGFFELGMKDWLSWIWQKGAELSARRRWAERILSVTYLQWRGRNLEVFERRRMQLEQRMRMIGDLFEEDETLMRMGDLTDVG